ncbi:hypothetical protein amb1350 [Paramagnetospirillum magneticum AMB-1]|uniref:Uncharacterized protein n=1 Tax=Paramagnetospirillum magneticum (strain ATCC 700264 / AMB-1) TaxID=342108 RepID=Q2W7M1_PARM1|nr:hypothetical protein amb1350 [Paramagnetospirillum magneticum AMB-1]
MDTPPSSTPADPQSGGATRTEPPENCPVKDRCRRARAQLCLDCGTRQRKRKKPSADAVSPPRSPRPADPR